MECSINIISFIFLMVGGPIRRTGRFFQFSINWNGRCVYQVNVVKHINLTVLDPLVIRLLYTFFRSMGPITVSFKNLVVLLQKMSLQYILYFLLISKVLKSKFEFSRQNSAWRYYSLFGWGETRLIKYNVIVLYVEWLN